MKNKNGKGNINIYLFWPIIISVLLIMVNTVIFYISFEAERILFLFTCIIIGFSIYLFISRKNNFKRALLNYVSKNTSLHTKFLKEVGIPYIICNIDGQILWANDKFLSIDEKFSVKKNVTQLFSDLPKELFNALKNEKVNILISYKEKKFNLHIRSVKGIDIEGISDTVFMNPDDRFLFIYFEDKTEFFTLKENYENEKTVIGFIYIDNYEEGRENIEDSKAALLIAMMERKLTRYVSNNGGILKKLEKDKYFFVTDKKGIEEMLKDRFSILDDTKDIINNDNLPLTLSIGVGYEGKSIETNNDLARQAIDMALGRGGDQAVVKKGQEVFFYGGKSASTNSSARVRARVKASLFREILESRDRVLIMGHQNGDLDSMGASIGIYVMTKFAGKKVHIVQNTTTQDVSEFREKYKNNDNYPEDMFIDGDTAVSLVNSDTLLVMVDHNTPKISDEKRIVELTDSIVIFDHHRIQTSTLKNTLMSYIEPSASSASELVCEMVKFFDDGIKLKPLEADAMLAGIMLDTLNFTYHTTSKTFEAASFLKKSGADTDKVRKLLRSDIKEEEIKNQTIMSCEYYKNSFAIAVVKDIQGIDKQVIASKIANELIDIKNIKASIVIYKDKNEYSISSRSIDEVNVQVLMEGIGGGGHRSQAGARIEAENEDEVKEKIKKLIDDMIEKKEII